MHIDEIRTNYNTIQSVYMGRREESTWCWLMRLPDHLRDRYIPYVENLLQLNVNLYDFVQSDTDEQKTASSNCSEGAVLI